MRIDKRKLNMILADKCLTQSEAAEKSGLSSGRYNRIINAETVLPKTAGKIARGLGVHIEDIICMEDYKENG